jgi:KAP family P-loop domain
MEGTGLFGPLSDSASRAMRWSIAAAAIRTGQSPSTQGPEVVAADLLIGILFAHPDPDGEARVLLQHFGLTARDLLPAGYPVITVADLQHRADEVPVSLLPVFAADLGDGMSALPPSRTTTRLYELLGVLLVAPTALRQSLDTALSAVGEDPSALVKSYASWAATDPARQGIAGKSLAQWLRQHHPRRPVQLPAYSSDHVDAGHDLIGIGIEAEAFAYLIASRDLRPPLAVGLFGEWGSGKTFLMHAVRDRVARLVGLVAAADQATVPVWKQIRQIDFNAWEYVQGELWAALLERIFGALGSVPMSTSLVAEARAPLTAELTADQASAEAAALRIAELVKDRQSIAADLARAMGKAQESRSAAAQRLERAGAKVNATTAKVLADVWGDGSQPLVRDTAAAIALLGDAKTQLQRGQALRGPYWRSWQRILLLGAGAAVLPVVALGLGALHAPALVALLGAVASAAPVVATGLRSATAWTGSRLSDIEDAQRQARQQLLSETLAADLAVADAERRMAEVDDRLAAERARIAELQVRKANLRERIEAMTPARVFVEYADERSSDYRRRLGLLARVRKDLGDLQTRLREQNRGLLDGPDRAGDPGAMPNRIVLYIDDLDRCPPPKVLEVLEAVHLLLAFELFVVVVAVDTRWLSSALTVQLSALRAEPAEGQPSPRDYLEKIFQVPFWVQPLSDTARSHLLRGLLVPSVRPAEAPAAPGEHRGDLHAGPEHDELLRAMLEKPGTGLQLEASQLALTPADLEFIASLAPLIGDTPRRIKRFVNTSQLLLAMRPPLAHVGTPSERDLVCFAAAVNEGLPTVAQALFPLAAAGHTESLAVAVRALQGTVPAERDLLDDWLTKRPAWATVGLHRLGGRLDMVRRFRFT